MSSKNHKWCSQCQRSQSSSANLVERQLGVINLILGLLLLRRDNFNPLRRIVLQAAIALVIISQLLMVIGAIVFSLFPSNIAEQISVVISMQLRKQLELIWNVIVLIIQSVLLAFLSVLCTVVVMIPVLFFDNN